MRHLLLLLLLAVLKILLTAEVLLASLCLERSIACRRVYPHVLHLNVCMACLIAHLEVRQQRRKITHQCRQVSDRWRQIHCQSLRPVSCKPCKITLIGQ